MTELVSLTGDILLNQVVCSIVVEDSMDFLGAVATDIWPKHDTAFFNTRSVIFDKK